MPYQEARKLVEHPVSCVDCHDPRTMGLRVTRPGFVKGNPGAGAFGRSGTPIYPVSSDGAEVTARKNTTPM
jgi:nitrite reductase (cytochrome c-552)